MINTKWIAAEVEFKALGELVHVSAVSGGAAHRDVPTRVAFNTIGFDRGGDASGHAGNDLWWSAPRNVVTIGNVRMSAYEATRLARWILSLTETPCDACRKNTEST